VNTTTSLLVLALETAFRRSQTTEELAHLTETPGVIMVITIMVINLSNIHLALLFLLWDIKRSCV
jgi:hypothetical protein